MGFFLVFFFFFFACVFTLHRSMGSIIDVPYLICHILYLSPSLHSQMEDVFLSFVFLRGFFPGWSGSPTL
jgi:hypothetical protein